jgi:hypothetical protein
MKTRAWILAGTLSLSLVAAAEDATRSPRKLGAPQRIPDPTVQTLQPVGSPVTVASVPREVRRAVAADAARRFQVAESAVVLGAVEQVTWSDGSLGCPQPGMSYTQLQVPGYRVSATTAAGKMVYHTDMHGHAVTCGLPRGARKPEPRTQPPPRNAPDR